MEGPVVFYLVPWRVVPCAVQAAIQVVSASPALRETVALKLPPEMPLSQLTVKASDLQLNYGKSK